MAQQLIFDWPVGVSLGPADFFVSDANATAYALVQDPDRWPEDKLVLIGPPGCGKSHLARVFQKATGADLIAAPDLTAPIAASGPMIVEDVDTLPRSGEENLFHLHNNLRSAGFPLLMTARSAPSRWDIALPDLASRMQATTPAPIDDPDDALLQAVVMKLFADRQLMPPPDVVAYLARRIERSFLAAADAVERLDTAALAAKKPITRPFAARVLDNPTP